jgi:superfamily II DNA helicase RecQ
MKTDYREKLDPDTFARFARLRQARKRWAEEAGVPVYAIFTNAQLAAVAQAQPASQTALQEIDGIGPAKAGTYGERVLAILAEPPPA